MNNPLILRPIRTKDAGSYYEIFGDPEICRYDDFSPITEDESVEDIVRILDGYARLDENTELAIELAEEGKMIGVFAVLCGLKYKYIGYHFNRRYWGRGFASLVVNMYLDTLKPKDRALIRARVDSQNAASIRVLEKCGFRRVSSRRLENATREWVYHWQPGPRK